MDDEGNQTRADQSRPDVAAAVVRRQGDEGDLKGGVRVGVVGGETVGAGTQASRKPLDVCKQRATITAMAKACVEPQGVSVRGWACPLIGCPPPANERAPGGNWAGGGQGVEVRCGRRVEGGGKTEVTFRRNKKERTQLSSWSFQHVSAQWHA